MLEGYLVISAKDHVDTFLHCAIVTALETQNSTLKQVYLILDFCQTAFIQILIDVF